MVVPIQDQPYIRSSPRHSKLYLWIHKVATLPSAVPLLTTKTLPDLFRLATFIGLNILWGWNRFQFSSDYALYGWLTLANGGLALLLGARSNVFAAVARIPSTTLLMYHRWTGRATVIHATIHFAALVRSYAKSDQLSTVVQTVRIQVGLGAWISLALIAITSISLIRRRAFELFYFFHALFLLFVVGALIHATRAAEFIVPGLALYFIDRVIRFSYNFRKVEVVSMTQYASGMTKFQVRGVRKHQPGQVAWVQIPGASKINWHPFTIVSSPAHPEHATFAVRGLGNFTKKVQALAAAAEGIQEIKQTEKADPISRVVSPLKIRVDGPYGVGHTQWGIHPLTIIVAGGIGITPGISIATHIIERANRLGAPGNGLRWNVHMLWVLKAPQHMAWFEEELAYLAAATADRSVPVNFHLRIHVTGDHATRLDIDESSSQQSQPSNHPRFFDSPGLIHHGRPDLRAYFRTLRAQHPDLDAVVSACGPRTLIDSVRSAAVAGQNHGSHMGAYHVDEEVFEL